MRRGGLHCVSAVMSQCTLGLVELHGDATLVSDTMSLLYQPYSAEVCYKTESM